MATVRHFYNHMRSLFETLFRSEWISYDEFWSRALETRNPIHS